MPLGAALVSGVNSTLLAANGADFRLLEVDEGALRRARRVRPRAIALGNLFRDQLEGYGELEHTVDSNPARARRLVGLRRRLRPARRRARG